MLTRVLPLFLLALTLGACTKPAATMPDGSAIAIMVAVDRGIEPGFNEGQIDRRNQVGDWMEADLVKILNNWGYQASIAGDTQPGPGRYVLTTRITNYNPGSKAARMFGGIVGGIAGKAVVDTHWELLGEGGSMTGNDESVASTEDWNYAVRKVNKLTVQGLTARLKQGL